VVIDDTGALDGSAFDLLLNQNPYASETMYPESSPNRLLLGLDYALIRPEVARLIGASKSSGQSLEVVVALGGTDVAGLGPALCDALTSIDGVSVSLASGFSTLSSTSQQAASEDRAVTLVPSVNLPEVLARSDLAVVAAGSIVWEAATLGVPMIAVVVADNQAPLLNDPVVAHMAQVIDAPSALDLNSFVGVVQGVINDGELRGRMSSAGSNLIDGKGVDRVVASILSVHESSRSTSEGRR
jgi:UDP-2,4-diacetamido-2,4,6-trideoxy-beta-L-altropyranose hydrolase